MGTLVRVRVGVPGPKDLGGEYFRDGAPRHSKGDTLEVAHVACFEIPEKRTHVYPPAHLFSIVRLRAEGWAGSLRPNLRARPRGSVPVPMRVKS